MIEETHHFVLSRFERTRNSLERILTINYFFSIFIYYFDYFRKHSRRERVLCTLSLVISLALAGISPQPRDRYWDISLTGFVNSVVAH